MARASPLHSDDHRKTQALLPWYVTSQVDAAEADRIEAHLQTCAECREQLETEQGLRAAFATAPLEAGWTAPPRRRFAWIAAVGAVLAASVVIALVTVAPTRLEPRFGAYHALGAAPEPPGVELIVVFQPERREREMRAVLSASHARIVDGPTAAGAYVLRVPVGEGAQALATLRHDPSVQLAESLGGPP
jgi:hypothetical protein